MKGKTREKYLSHSEWILCQFDKCRLELCYRNVFVHTSIIEGLLIDESEEKNPFPDEKEKKCQKRFRTISYAMELLNKDKDKDYRGLFINRNDLIHGIARKKNPLCQNVIEEKIKKMWHYIINLYKEDYINSLFNKRSYSFNPKDKVIEIKGFFDESWPIEELEKSSKNNKINPPEARP